MSDRYGRRTLTGRLVAYFAVTYLALIAVMGWVVDTRIRDAAFRDLLAGMEDTARVALDGVPGEPEAARDWVRRQFDASGFRFTVIGADGTVLADSHADAAGMDDHSTRPEVAAALAGQVGTSSRLSSSTGVMQHYLALPPENGVVLRLSFSERELQERLAPIRSTVIGAAVLAGAIGILLVVLVARRIAAPIARLTEHTQSLASGAPVGPPAHTAVRELDMLGTAIGELDRQLRERVVGAERAGATLEVVLATLPQATILVGEDDGILYANPAAYQMLGSIPETLAGLTPFPFQTAVLESRGKRVPIERTVEHGRPARMLRGVATPFADDLRTLLVVVDVTERERSDSIRRDFVANASHELKTPISTIVAASEAMEIALRRGDDPSGFASRIRSSAEQMGRLVADLLDLSRVERERPAMEPFDLGEMVGEEVERIRPVADAAGVQLHLEAESRIVVGSRADLGTAVRNLLDNAVRHTQAGGSVHVEVGSEEGATRLVVRDNGEGIPTRDLGRVFERFYRVDASRSRSTGGTGLGLAIVKHVVESHGGNVDVESELGAGSAFTVRLPRR